MPKTGSDKQKKYLHISGLRQRWIINTIMPVFVLLVLVVTLFSAGVASYYYSGMQRGLEIRVQDAADSFNSYFMNSYTEYYQMAVYYTDSFDDKDRIELQFISPSGRIQASSYGLTVGTSPRTSDIEDAVSSGEKAVFQGKDPATGESILSVAYPLMFNGRVVGVMAKDKAAASSLPDKKAEPASDKEQAIKTAISQIEKAYGKGSIM